MLHDLILGTAGHIDHGKTSLIRALTGTDTDRLPEEKRRGITIELGFAELVVGQYRLGIVDVPGHERFVRQMLAGATGMDLAMLVVAADDSVKPQTVEHLEVLKYLDLAAGVIVLTKCDLADPDWVELVAAEVRELVQDSFLARAPIVRTSAATGAGLSELRQALEEAAAQAYQTLSPLQRSGPFRMAIDRSFTIAGHGTVVTGSVASGQVSVGDQLVIEPGRIEVRVRGLQNHDRPTDSIHRGQRAAINLSGARHDEIVRGHELASPGHLVASRLLTVQLRLLDTLPRSLKSRTRVRLHVGTAEVLARVQLLGTDSLSPGETGWAQLILQEPTATVWNQPFVIRAESPAMTIGGGRVLVPDARRIRKLDEIQAEQLSNLSEGTPVDRASAALFFAEPLDWEPSSLVRTAGVIEFDTVVAELRRTGELLQLPTSQRRTLPMHRHIYVAWSWRVVQQLERLLNASALKSWIEVSALAQAFPRMADDTFLIAVLQRMHAEGLVHLRGQRVTLPSYQPQLSKGEAALFETLLATFATSGFQPPTMGEFQKAHLKFEKSIRPLFDLAVADGTLVHIGGDLFFHRDSLQQVYEKLRACLATGEGKSVSEIRELLGTTRKYAVPLCEYLDKTGFTRRQGDLRFLARPV